MQPGAGGQVGGQGGPGGPQMNKGVEDNNVRNQYSIPGILHFIQHEWAR